MTPQLSPLSWTLVLHSPCCFHVNHFPQSLETSCCLVFPQGLSNNKMQIDTVHVTQHLPLSSTLHYSTTPCCNLCGLFHVSVWVLTQRISGCVVHMYKDNSWKCALKMLEKWLGVYILKMALLQLTVSHFISALSILKTTKMPLPHRGEETSLQLLREPDNYSICSSALSDGFH